jgi:hypothetical protein
MFSTESGAAIEAECIKITLRFFRCLDTREHATAAQLFAPDGVWNRPGTVLSGRAAILESLHKRPPERTTAHLLSNVWSEALDADHARVHFYLTLRERLAAPGEPATVRSGSGVLYGVDTFVRSAEGWRIQTKATQPVLAAAEAEQ